jgi:hypothetical protein
MTPPIKDRPRNKAVQRATRTSDVTRARMLALAAVGAAFGAGGALIAGTMPTGSERPIARPHEKAKIACARCHDAASAEGTATGTTRTATATNKAVDAATFAASGACKSCHAKAKHSSDRAAHRALAARGELTCAG